MRRIIPCSQCSKPLELVKSHHLSGDTYLNTYKCGHIFTYQGEAQIVCNHIATDNKTEQREYQKIGTNWIVNDTHFNAILGDQQRLGKTNQAFKALAADYKNRTPCLILVRSANLYDILRQYKFWCDNLPNGIYPITSQTKFFIPPGFSSYIISMNLFSRGDMVERLLKFGFKLVIVDECHSFKNTDSKRSQALMNFLKEISKTTETKITKFICHNCSNEWKESVTKTSENGITKTLTKAYCPKCNALVFVQTHKEEVTIKKRKCGVIMLSGTPLKNRADELFVPLNIVAPEIFPSEVNFKRDWLQQDSKGKYSRVKEWRLEEFKRVISPYFLRREKEDVFTDLPPLNRMFTMITVENESLKKAYNKVIDDIEAKMELRSLKMFDTIGELTKLRQICGLAKVEWAAEYLRNAIEDTDKPIKYAVGIHHHGVRDNLALLIKDLGVVKLSGEDNAFSKDRIMRTFQYDNNKVLILNMLAGGVGMDFHYCPNVLILERQWSYADEEQFEFRFYNPDKKIMGENVSTNIEYCVCKDTVDEFFYDLIEEKKMIHGETISNNWDLMSDGDSFRKLLERTVGSRL